MVDVQPFTETLILSLDAPIKDKEGIPYAGVVQYNPATENYSYIATANEGQVIPAGSGAFSWGSHYLATRTNGTVSELVVYDRARYVVSRVVATLNSVPFVPFVAWSPTGTTFAYKLAGQGSAELKIEGLNTGAEVKTLGQNFPIGFSPDGSKLLSRDTLTLAIVDINDGKLTQTTGAAFLGKGIQFFLSPDGFSLIAVSEREVDWYKVNWENGTLHLVQKIVSPKRITDTVFTPAGALVVREEGSKLVRLYELSGESLSESFATITLPENARILHVIQP